MISIIIPVYNEEAIIAHSLRTIIDFCEKNFVFCEIIVADNGSTDKTQERVAEAQLERVRYIRTSTYRAPGNAFLQAARIARGTIIVTLDADISSDLNFIPRAIELFKLRDVDVVVGCKTLGHQRRSLLRLFGSWLYTYSVQRLLDLNISDFSMGCKAFRTNAIYHLFSHNILDDGTGYILELILEKRGGGGGIIQIGVDCYDKRKSKFNLTHEFIYKFNHLRKLYARRKNSCAPKPAPVT